MVRSKFLSRFGLQSQKRWLRLIAAYKFLYALLFFAIGIGAHRLLHKDMADEIETLAHYLRFNPESHLVSFVLAKTTIINDPMLRRIGLFANCYAALTLAESIGLYFEKAWGEFLTLAISASFLPFEILEIARRVTWVRISLLTINLVVFIYLLRVVIERVRKRGKSLL